MRFPSPKAEFCILVFDRKAKPGSPARRGRYGEANGFPYLGRLCVSGRPIGEVGLSQRDADLRELQKIYARTAPHFDDLVKSLAKELKWSDGAALALAIAFVSPTPPERFYGWRHIGPRRRGRPPTTNRLTKQVRLLSDAWELITGQPARTSADTAFIHALNAAAPYLKIHNRSGRALSKEYAHESVQREAKKLVSRDFVMISPRVDTSN